MQTRGHDSRRRTTAQRFQRSTAGMGFPGAPKTETNGGSRLQSSWRQRCCGSRSRRPSRFFPDEAYYWVWSSRLAGGYFDHPPAIAILIRAGAWLTAPLGVRFMPILAGFVATLATAATARRLGGDRAALHAAVLIACIPLTAAALSLATPDAPLLAATSLGLYAVVRVLEHSPRSRASFAWWIAAGLALGLALCSKYTPVVLARPSVSRWLRVTTCAPGFASPGLTLPHCWRPSSSCPWCSGIRNTGGSRSTSSSGTASRGRRAPPWRQHSAAKEAISPR